MTTDPRGTGPGHSAGGDAAAPSRFAGRGFIAAAVVVALVLGAGIVLSIQTLTGDDNDPGPQTGTPPTTTGPVTTGDPTQPSNDPNASLCGLEGFEDSGTPTTAPPVDWVLVGRQVVPSSPDAGPGVYDKSTQVRYCYAHTPEGALLAAANAFAWGPAIEAAPEEVVERNIAPGPGRDAYAQLLADATDEELTGTRVDTDIRGFRILTYTAEAAMIDIAAFTVVDDGTGTLASFVGELHWVDGDWKAVFAADGVPTRVTPLADVTGYTAWGPE